MATQRALIVILLIIVALVVGTIAIAGVYAHVARCITKWIMESQSYKGGFDNAGLLYELSKDSAIPPPVLIVDIANMYPGWYMETFHRDVPYAGDQTKLISRYLQCMSAHYEYFVLVNTQGERVMYVMKNHQIGVEKAPSDSEIIKPQQWAQLCEFTAARPRAYICVAEDYTRYASNIWRDPRNHYLRGRDDYTLFELARRAKREYCRAVIMTNDKFDDFNSMGTVPPFNLTIIHDGKTVSQEKIKPRPNALGQIKDYAISRHNLNFKLSVPAARQPAPADGQVWRF